MNNLGKLLWKIFCTTMVFFYNIGDSRVAYGDDGCDANKNIILNKCYDEEDHHMDKRTKTLCPSGKYLVSCGGKYLGTNWLKGMKYKVCTNSSDKKETPDYYSYNSTDADNMTNLRKFFAGKESIGYASSTCNTNDSGCTSTESVSVGPDIYVSHRNNILANFCLDDNGKLLSDTWTCQKCPNAATIPASDVDFDYDTGKILCSTWNIHTIADCYMREFTDNTGTYIYTVENTGTSDMGMQCFYSKEVSGSSLKGS